METIINGYYPLIADLGEPKFCLGQVVATSNFISRIKEIEDINADEVIQLALIRHQSGDWGDCCPEDSKTNDHALENGNRLLSVYNWESGEEPLKFWVITEWDRSATTILLPEDY